ncbi:MAG: hypothetical protein A3C47_05825 [Omnitrophica bacterium RIFCSPHIGHO2_02_FULL_51_18]|nr:MAG: hypothetical protein A3C47_05825 [Omnitrophica bacterium RIFCSPHIGHO2_02_FULL_51_18]
MKHEVFRKIAWVCFFTAFAGVSCVLSGCLETKKSGATLARFDGTTLTESDFVAKIKNLSRELQNVVLRRRKDFVGDMVDEHFLEKEAKKRAVQNLPDVKELIQQAQRKIVIAKLIELEVDRKISLGDGEAEKYYEAHKEQFMTPLLLRASHILAATKEEADAVKSMLSSGSDFAELARARSIDSTASRGGDLGFFQKGQLIPEFEEAAFKMNPGDTSEVFKTQFGYHIIQLTDRAEPKLRDFRAVKSAVEKQLINEKRSKRYREFVEKLKTGAKIEIDEKNLNALFQAPSAKTK